MRHNLASGQHLSRVLSRPTGRVLDLHMCGICWEVFMDKPKVIVVGAGVMGMSAGCALAGRGADVTVLERHTLGHDWASSHGLTRAIRHEYGDAAIYTHMVALSLPLWSELAQETGRHL